MKSSQRRASRLVVAGSVILLALPTPAAYALDDGPVDTGWDLVSVDLGASLDDPDTTDPITSVVLREPGTQAEPERSPDGTRIAYTSGDPARPDRRTSQIFIREPDGRGRRVTHHPTGADQPTWSPTGERLAFVGRDDGIYTIGADGTHERNLVPAGASGPDWSPDGRRIVFQRGGADGGEIWTVNVRTGRLRRLTHSEPSPERCQRRGRMDLATWAKLPACHYLSRDPTWSPDGRWIAFLRHEDKPGGWLTFEDTDLWLMRADGSDKHRAVAGEVDPMGFPASSPDGHFQGPPTWSPDGRYLALTGGHCLCLLLVDVATGTPRQVRYDLFERMKEDLDWSQDGTLIGVTRDPRPGVAGQRP